MFEVPSQMEKRGLGETVVGVDVSPHEGKCLISPSKNAGVHFGVGVHESAQGLGSIHPVDEGLGGKITAMGLVLLGHESPLLARETIDEGLAHQGLSISSHDPFHFGYLDDQILNDVQLVVLVVQEGRVVMEDRRALRPTR